MCVVTANPLHQVGHTRLRANIPCMAGAWPWPLSPPSSSSGSLAPPSLSLPWSRPHVLVPPPTPRLFLPPHSEVQRLLLLYQAPVLCGYPWPGWGSPFIPSSALKPSSSLSDLIASHNPFQLLQSLMIHSSSVLRLPHSILPGVTLPAELPTPC